MAFSSVLIQMGETRFPSSPGLSGSWAVMEQNIVSWQRDRVFEARVCLRRVCVTKPAAFLDFHH